MIELIRVRCHDTTILTPLRSSLVRRLPDGSSRLEFRCDRCGWSAYPLTPIERYVVRDVVEVVESAADGPPIGWDELIEFHESLDDALLELTS